MSLFVLLFVVCLSVFTGLMLAYLCGYLSERCEQRMRKEEAEEVEQDTNGWGQAAPIDNDAKVRWVQQQAEQAIELQWLQQQGLTEVSRSRWVN